MNKKVSIVLPVYNGAKYVKDSIESIIAQTYCNWELIIVDDCSTDNTLEICHKIANTDERICVISNERNMKLPNALNIGFQKATGDYYTWTSDDNLYKPYAIETLVKEIKHNPDVLMVYSDYTEIDFDGKLLNKIKLQNPERMVLGNVFGACFLYSAQIAKKIGGYDPELFLAEDYDYWIRIYKHGRILHIPQNLYFYRRHTESLSETKKAYIDEQTYKAIEKNFFLLYVTAKRYSLEFDFFDEVLKRGQAHVNKTKRLLMILNRRYYLYLMWISLKKSLHGTVIHKVYHKLKRKS